MKVAIFPDCMSHIPYTNQQDSQFLAESPARFCRAACLDANDLDQVDNATRVLHFILLACEDLYLHGHCRVWFLWLVRPC